MKDKTNDFDYETLKKKTLEQFRSGKSLFGKDGALAPLLKDFIESALEAELENHLNEASALDDGIPNRRNGYTKKQLKTNNGSFEIETPRDRLSEFEPILVKKRETILADQLEDKIIGLYGLGMSLRDISLHIKELYDTDISATTLSSITDRVIPQITAWQSRPLESLYCIVWLDAMFYKVKQDHKIITKCVYNILGINIDGKKELLGCYISESEGANFWLSVLSDLQNRGLKDILIACIDNLNGFEEAILTIFPKTEVQSCVVHQIRNSLKYVASKDQKAFLADLKAIYQASNKESAEMNLIELAEKWGGKYPAVVGSWQRNWHKLSTYFKYTAPIRRLIYTTNSIEGYHRQIRKVTKSKGAFTSDTALLKLIYLASKNIQQKWTSPLMNWSITISQLKIYFNDRVNLHI